MNKMIHYAKKNSPFAIMTATYVENLENFIFVEAHKIDSVREAITGLNFCYQKIDHVPLTETTKIFEDQAAQLEKPVPNQWVRIKTGLYAGDLGIVERLFKED